jgi:hypothetical protein
MRHSVPAFTLEVEIWSTIGTSPNYADRAYVRPSGGLEYWMRTSVHIPLQLLANADRLRGGQYPTEQPPLPEGGPPKPPASYAELAPTPLERPLRGFSFG